MMKLALTVNAWLDEELMFAQQLGADQVIAWVSPAEPGLEEGKKPNLAAIRNRVEKAGLELLGLDSSLVPVPNQIPGEAGLSQDIEIYRHLITDAGTAGIHLISYQWTDPQQRWERLAYFLDSILPTAEKAGVRLAGRLNPKAFIREWTHQTHDQLWNNLPNPHNGLDFNPGVPDLRNGSTLFKSLQQPDLCERLFLITFDHILPDLPAFDLAEGNMTGPLGLLEGLEILHQAGCTASVRPYRPSQDSSDVDYQALAYAAGYLRASLQTLKSCANRTCIGGIT